MKASVIIATYNREKDLVRSIRSVLAQTYKDFELIVVDQTIKHQKSTQHFIHSIKDPRFKYYRVGPPSIPAAENFGVAKATGEVTIFVDDDVELDDGFIDEHIKAYSDPKVGGVAGRIKVPGEPESKVLYHITSTGWNVGSFNCRFDALTSSGVRGCNMSFRKKVLDELGGFDTSFIKNAHRFESDMSYRVIKSGYQIPFRASASLTHYHTSSGGSRASSGLFRDAASFANDFRFFYKNMNGSKRVLLGFYMMHLLYVVPHPNPIVFLKRLYYLFTGSRMARQDLKRGTRVLVARTLGKAL